MNIDWRCVDDSLDMFKGVAQKSFAEEILETLRFEIFFFRELEVTFVLSSNPVHNNRGSSIEERTPLGIDLAAYQLQRVPCVDYLRPLFLLLCVSR